MALPNICPKKFKSKYGQVISSPFLSKNLFDYFENTTSTTSSIPTVVTSSSVVTLSSVVTSSSAIMTSTCSSVVTTNSSSYLSSSSISVSSLPSVVVSSALNDSPSQSILPCSGDKYDISGFFNLSSKLSDKDKYDLIKNSFKPDKSYDFPNKNIKKPAVMPFLFKWLEEFSWLRYSKFLDGGLCIPCSLFAHSSTKFSNQENLISKPVFANKAATTLFKRHESPNGLHMHCLIDMQSFLLRYEGKNLSIDKNKVEHISNAKKVLPSVIDAVILCGHMGIPLRGHRDDKRFFPDAGQYSKSSGLGNFIEILNFAIRQGDKTLEKHYKNHPANAS